MAIVVPIISEWNAQGVQRAMADIEKAGSGFDKFALGVEKASKVAAIALGGLATAAFSFAKLAAEDEKSSRQLQKTLQNVTKATDAQVASVEDYISKTSLALGIQDDKLRPAFGRLVRSTEDATEAQKLLNLALDISAGTGKDLDSVTNALGKAYDGNTNALGRLGLGIDQSILKTGDFNKVYADLATRFDGFAKGEAATTEGSFARLTVAIDEAKESIGVGFLPIIEKLVPKLQEAAKWIQENSDKIADVTIKVGLFLASIITLNAAIKTVTTSLAILDGVIKLVNFSIGVLTGTIALNPLGLLIVGSLTLIGYLVYLYNTSEKFRAKWDEIYQSFTRFPAVVLAITAGFSQIISVVSPVVQLFQRLLDTWNSIKSAVGLGATITPTIAPTTTNRRESTATVSLSEEQIARGISNILQRSDFRNGRTLGVI